MSDLQMLYLPWFNVKEKIQRLREIGILWICHLRPTHLPCKGPEDTPFTVVVRSKFVRRAPTSLKSSVITLLCRPDLTVETAVTELGNLNTVGVIGSCRGRMYQRMVLYYQRQDRRGYQNRQQSPSSNQNSLDLGSHMALASWLWCP